MSQRPPLSLVWKAIDTYLEEAYGASLPLPVRSRVEALRVLDDEAFFSSGLIEREDGERSTRYCLRLGNRIYPHMKLMVEPAPGGAGFVFCADCHDRHCCPPKDSPEYDQFLELMDQNRLLAQSIEAAWARENVPTFQALLRHGAELRREKHAARPH